MERDPHKVVEMVNEIGRLLKEVECLKKPVAAEYGRVWNRPGEKGSASPRPFSKA